MSSWRFLAYEEEQGAAHHMALAEVLLRSVSQGKSPPTFRFLRFRPCVLIGRHQVLEEEVDVPACREHGYECNRRVSGGGAIVCDSGCLGWEFVAPRGVAGLPREREELRRTLCTAVAAGLSRLGVRVGFRPRNDLEVNGRKVGGTGGVYTRDAFLYHGTVLLSYDPELFGRLLRLPLPKLQKHGASSLAARVTSLSWELGREPALEEVEEAVRDGLKEFLGISLVPAPLTPFEEGELASLLPFFRSEVWVDGERKKARYSGEARLFFPGGTVSCGVLLGGDPSSPVVREVFFSGDFFLQPPEALSRLEASLKGCNREEAEARISSFFASGAPGDGCGHAEFLAVFRAAVEEALKKEGSQ